MQSRLTFRDVVLIATAADYFEAFGKIRLQLEAIGLLPLCFAASRNVYPSPMSRNMGNGLKAYRLTIGQPARSDDLVEIFASEGALDITTVANQLRFYESWLRSL